MARQDNSGEKAPRKRAPAVTPEQRNNQLIAMSYDAAEQMILDGKATSQLLVHFLKQGTARDELERIQIEHKNILIQAQTERLGAQEDLREVSERAIIAMTEYKGGTVGE